MAFIKRSTTKIEKATVGERMRKCASCGIPFVCKQNTNLCLNCIPRTVTPTADDTAGIPDFDLDTE